MWRKIYQPPPALELAISYLMWVLAFQFSRSPNPHGMIQLPLLLRNLYPLCPQSHLRPHPLLSMRVVFGPIHPLLLLLLPLMFSQTLVIPLPCPRSSLLQHRNTRLISPPPQLPQLRLPAPQRAARPLLTDCLSIVFGALCAYIHVPLPLVHLQELRLRQFPWTPTIPPWGPHLSRHPPHNTCQISLPLELPIAVLERGVRSLLAANVGVLFGRLYPQCQEQQPRGRNPLLAMRALAMRVAFGHIHLKFPDRRIPTPRARMGINQVRRCPAMRFLKP